MRLRPFVLLPVLALAFGACSGTGSSTSATSAPLTPGASSSSVATPASGAAQTINIRLSDALRMSPSSMTVKAGVPVRFVVTNTGSTDHEFYLGDEAAQEEHDMEMSGMGGMTHDEAEGIGLKAGETKELAFTFPKAGTYLAGCHVNGHYAAGMKATITVTG